MSVGLSIYVDLLGSFVAIQKLDLSLVTLGLSRRSVPSPRLSISLWIPIQGYTVRDKRHSGDMSPSLKGRVSTPELGLTWLNAE